MRWKTLLCGIVVYGNVHAVETKKEPNPIPLVNLEINAGFGYRLFGEQLKIARESLSPTPDYYVHFLYGARLTLMPANFGIQAGFQRNLFRATSLQAGGGYSVYTYDTIDVGGVYAMPMTLSQGSATRYFLTFAAGLNYSMLQYADQFKNDLQASAARQGKIITFDSTPATGIGGYVQIGVLIYPVDHLFLSFALRIDYINPRFRGATKSLDGLGFEIPFGIGIGF